MRRQIRYPRFAVEFQRGCSFHTSIGLPSTHLCATTRVSPGCPCSFPLPPSVLGALTERSLAVLVGMNLSGEPVLMIQDLSRHTTTGFDQIQTLDLGVGSSPLPGARWGRQSCSIFPHLSDAVMGFRWDESDFHCPR